MIRTVLSLMSLLGLLALTVLLPPSAFFDPDPTPIEVQLPEERPCTEHAACGDALVWIDERGVLQQLPKPYARPIIWPQQTGLSEQFLPQTLHRPPEQV